MKHIKRIFRILVVLHLVCVLAHLPHVAYWGNVDGHRGCWAIVADTSYVACPDGYTTSS
jgi:hypothetical protein